MIPFTSAVSPGNPLSSKQGCSVFEVRAPCTTHPPRVGLATSLLWPTRSCCVGIEPFSPFSLAGAVKGSTPRTERDTQVCISHQIASYGSMPDPPPGPRRVVLIGPPTPWNGVSVHNCHMFCIQRSGFGGVWLHFQELSI